MGKRGPKPLPPELRKPRKSGPGQSDAAMRRKGLDKLTIWVQQPTANYIRRRAKTEGSMRKVVERLVESDASAALDG